VKQTIEQATVKIYGEPIFFAVFWPTCWKLYRTV